MTPGGPAAADQDPDPGTDSELLQVDTAAAAAKPGHGSAEQITVAVATGTARPPAGAPLVVATVVETGAGAVACHHPHVTIPSCQWQALAA